jgi:CRISPR/Cas system-associated protein endoribonuclease Cas2
VFMTDFGKFTVHVVEYGLAKKRAADRALKCIQREKLRHFHLKVGFNIQQISAMRRLLKSLPSWPKKRRCCLTPIDISAGTMFAMAVRRQNH